MIELFKDGDQMAMRTDCPDEQTFQMEFVDMLSTMIDEGRYEGDWEFQLHNWLPQFVELCCKMRGYKADVQEQRVLVTGSRIFGDMDPVCAVYNGRVSGQVHIHGASTNKGTEPEQPPAGLANSATGTATSSQKTKA